MSLPGIRTIPVMLTPSGIGKSEQHSPVDVRAEKARLRKATRAFESFFMYQLLKIMRKTVPKSAFGEGAPFSGNMSKDIFTELFDTQLAQKMVTGDKNSISDMLYRSLEKTTEAQYNKANPDIKIKPLQKAREESFKVKRKSFKEIPRQESDFNLNSAAKSLLPVAERRKIAKNDPILSRFGPYIEAASKRTSLDPALIISVIKAESGGDPQAVSSAGAKGLMQLVDSTAGQYGVKDQFDPQENIDAGSQYLSDLISRFGSLRLALAAYNAGPSNVMRYKGVPPFKETEAYVEKVIDTLNTINRTAGTNAVKGRR